MNVIAIIQARMSSTRLPGKVLLPLADRTVLETIVQRVCAAKLVDKVVVATTLNVADKAIVDLCFNKDIYYFRGSENDVLDRVYKAAYHYQADVVVDITSDCPLVDPAHIDRLIKELNHSSGRNNRACHADYVSNCIERYWPDGLDVQVYTMNALKQIWLDYESVREHTGWNIHTLANKLDIDVRQVLGPRKYYKPHWGLTLDEPTDYTLIKKLFSDAFLKFGSNVFPVEWVLDFLLTNPELLDINKDVKRKEPGNVATIS